MFQKEKTYNDNWKMNDEDFNKAKSMFEEIKSIICCFNTSVMLYGLRSYIYGIVKGYTKDSYIVSTFYRGEGRPDTPVRFDSIHVNDIFRFIYLTKHDTIPINNNPNYLDVLQRTLKMMKGENITKEGYVAGPLAFDEWTKKLKEGQNTKNSYFGRHYHDARIISTEFLERVARLVKDKKQYEFIMNASKEHRIVKRCLEEIMMLFPYFEPEKIVFTEGTIEIGINTLLEAKKHEILAIRQVEDAIKNWE